MESDASNEHAWVCPQCRRTQPVPRVQQGKVARCARDGRALVTQGALARSDGDPFLGALVGDRYAILARIGAGSIAAVYRAYDERDEREAAVKIFRCDRRPEEREHVRARAEREASILRMLGSPHVVRFYGSGLASVASLCARDDAFGHGESAHFIAMELLHGEPLSARLLRQGRLNARDAIRFAKHTLEALADAHAKGIVHRDVKPDNLFLTRAQGDAEDVAKVLDFSLGLLGGQALINEPAGMLIGTPRYMSPEQAQGRAIDASSDVYAFGAVLYQMLTGQPPFADASAARVLARHISEMPVHPCGIAPEANIPVKLGDLVLRALAKRADDRFQNASDFLDELGHLERER